MSKVARFCTQAKYWVILQIGYRANSTMLNSTGASVVAPKYIRSSIKSPCPVCGRTKDKDCSLHPDGKTAHCKTYVSGIGHDESQWHYQGINKQGFQGIFVLKEEKEFVKTIRSKSKKYYYYPNRDGGLLMRVQRIDYGNGEKKDFYQSHWDGSKWVSNNPDEIKAVTPIYRHAEVQKAIERNEQIFIVEGEATADALWELGIAATTTIGGSGGYANYGNYTKDLTGGRLVLTPDRDEMGIKYMSNFDRDFSSQIEGWYLAGSAGLWKHPQGGMDIGDDLLDHKYTKEQIFVKIIASDAIGDYLDSSDSQRQNISQAEDDENTQFLQLKLGNLLEVKGKQAPSIFQGDLYKSLLSAANNFNIPVEILVFCLLPILSARIPSETRLLINPGTNYLVPALRWNALIGETGTKKSPVLKVLLAPLLSIQKQIATKYKEQKDIYDKEYGAWKTEKVNDRGEEPTPPAPMIDCYFSDFTIESIGQSISDHPDDSYLVFVDELAGFFKSMDAYRKAGGDRQKWLDLYNAGALKINRKGSPTIFCSHTSVSLLGGLQPSILEQMIKADESSEDGLWNRFMFCRLSQAKTAAFSHNSISLFDCLSSLYLNLAAAKPIEHKLSDAAKPLWEAWHDAIEDRIMTETSELVRGTYAKVEGVAGRNALIIHRVIAAQGEGQGFVPNTAISAEVMQMAIEWTQWELGQTLLEYQRLGLTEDPELSRILRFIDKFEGKGWVNARMVTHWWSPKPKPPANELRVFMAKVVSLGYATDNGKPSNSSDYQILILEKGGNNGNKHPETKPQQQESLLPLVITNLVTDTPGSSNDKDSGAVTTSGNKDGNSQNNEGIKLDPVVTADVVTTPVTTPVTTAGNSPNMAINGHHSDSDDNTVISSGNSTKAFSSKVCKPLVTTVTTIYDNKNLRIGDRVRVNGTEIEGEIAGWTKNRAEAWLQLDDGEITKNYASKDLIPIGVK